MAIEFRSFKCNVRLLIVKDIQYCGFGTVVGW